jgi:hypothetical protein
MRVYEQQRCYTAIERRWMGLKKNDGKSSSFCSSHKEGVGHGTAPQERLADWDIEKCRETGKS